MRAFYLNMFALGRRWDGRQRAEGTDVFGDDCMKGKEEGVFYC